MAEHTEYYGMSVDDSETSTAAESPHVWTHDETEGATY